MLSPVPSQKVLTPSPQTVSRTPIFTEGSLTLGPTTPVLSSSMPTSPPLSPPPPPPHSSFSSPPPDSSLRYTSNNTRLHISEAPEPFYIAKPEVLFSPELQIKSPSQLPQQHTSTVQVNKSSKTPDIELRVKDPYDELLSMILDGSGSTDDGDVLPSVESPPAQLTAESQSRRLQLKARESHEPAVAPESDSMGGVRLEMQFRKPVTMEPLSAVLLGEQSKTQKEQPSVKLKGYTELFIEEEDEAREDTEEDVRVLNERLSPPQVEHGVSCLHLV